MARDWRLRLDDMLASVGRIEKIDIATLQTSAETGPALERAFEILSEASRYIPEEIKSEYSHIRWRDLADLGNLLRHAYHRISLEELWETAQADVPPLKAALLKIRQEN